MSYDDIDPEGIDLNNYADIPGNTHLSDPLPEDMADGLEGIEAMKKLEDELEEQKDKFLRQAAEFENYKRRTSRERLELLQTAGKEIVVSLLDVLDDSNRAQHQMEKTDNLDQIKEGNSLVFAKLKSVLMQKGLKPMESIGEEFDVEKHEALSEIDVPQMQKGKVIDEIQKGYYLNDKIIRFAKVVVGK